MSYLCLRQSLAVGCPEGGTIIPPHPQAPVVGRGHSEPGVAVSHSSQGSPRGQGGARPGEELWVGRQRPPQTDTTSASLFPLPTAEHRLDPDAYLLDLYRANPCGEWVLKQSPT